MSDTLVKVVVDASQANRKLTVLPEVIRGRLRATIVRDTRELAALVRSNLSGAVLKIRTGRLFGSVRNEMVENSKAVYGRVYSVGVPYAAIHEYGGQTRPHLIRPVNARALHFFVGGREVFAKLVRHPGSRIPERSFMRSALAAMQGKLVDDMTAAVRHPGNWPAR